MNNVSITELLAHIDCKLAAQQQRLGTRFPYAADQTGFSSFSKSVSWWTNGFWPGTLWLRADVSGNEWMRKVATEYEAQLDENFVTFTGLHHDVGFQYGLSAVEDYRHTHSKCSYVRGLHAATILAGRYNPDGEFIRSWDDPDTTGWVIIDSLMNLPLLYWASGETHDPRFAAIARRHVETVINNHVRSDGTVAHICVFDPRTGRRLRTLAGQGYAPDSAWARGQAWAITGLMKAASALHEPKYAIVAKRVADSFIDALRANNGIPKLDFRQPRESQLIDTSAFVAASEGLLMLAAQADSQEQRELYAQTVLGTTRLLLMHYVSLTPDRDGILWGFSAAYDRPKEQNISCVYGDYYLIKLLIKLQNQFGDDCLAWKGATSEEE